MEEVFALDDFEALARERMDPGAFDYYAGGAWDEITLQENVVAFQRKRLRPRVLVDVSSIDLSTSVLGSHLAMPLGLAPAAFHGLAHPSAEVAVAEAAAKAGIVFCVSTLSSSSLEEVADGSDGRRWFQLYVYRDRKVSEELVKRAAAAGYEAIVLTVDLPLPGYRERELRRHFPFPGNRFVGNLSLVAGENERLVDLIADLHDASLTWRDVEWLRNVSALPVIVKGILTAEDARLAVDHGASAIFVSNHGGRQLDRTPATIDVLPEVVAAVDGRVEVYLDGGVRRGVDVLIALALGARAVFLGRPYLYALAAGGSDGVTRALDLLRTEIETGMKLLGAPSVRTIDRSYIFD